MRVSPWTLCDVWRARRTLLPAAFVNPAPNTSASKGCCSITEGLGKPGLSLNEYGRSIVD